MIEEGWQKTPPDENDRDTPSFRLLRLLGKAIRLDPDTALDLFFNSLDVPFTFDYLVFGVILLEANNVWLDRAEEALFRRFIKGLAEQRPPSPPA